jgi:hypothetical protein
VVLVVSNWILLVAGTVVFGPAPDGHQQPADQDRIARRSGRCGPRRRGQDNDLAVDSAATHFMCVTELLPLHNKRGILLHLRGERRRHMLSITTNYVIDVTSSRPEGTREDV